MSLCASMRASLGNPRSYLVVQGVPNSKIPTQFQFSWNRAGTLELPMFSSNRLTPCSRIVPTKNTKLEPWITFKYLMKSSTYKRGNVDNLWKFQNSSFFRGQRTLRCFLVRSPHPASVSIVLNKPYIASYFSIHTFASHSAKLLEFWNFGIM